MWSDVIVLLSPTPNQGFGFFQGEEDLAIEQFVAQLAVERLDIAVFLGTSWFDEKGLHAQSVEPLAQLLGNEFGTVI
jgi:hypothetical protein